MAPGLSILIRIPSSADDGANVCSKPGIKNSLERLNASDARRTPVINTNVTPTKKQRNIMQDTLDQCLNVPNIQNMENLKENKIKPIKA